MKKEKPKNTRRFSMLQSRDYGDQKPNISPSSGQLASTADRRELVAQAREELRNNPIVNAYLQSKVVGVLGDTPPKIRHSNSEIVEAWNAWTGRATVDYSGMRSFFDILRQLLQSFFIDGEGILYLYEDSGRLYADPLDSALIHSYGQTATGGVVRQGERLVDGLIFEGDRLTAYQLLRLNAQSIAGAFNSVVPALENQYAQAQARRIDARDILRIWRKSEVGIVRGIPPISALIDQLRSISKLERLTLGALKMSASKLGIISTTPDNQDIQQITDDLETEDGGTDDGEEELTPIIDTDEMSLWHMQNATFTPFNVGHIAMQHGEYRNNLIEPIAKALGVEPSALTGDFSRINYSAGRIAATSARDALAADQEQFAREIMTPLFLRWQAATGREELGGGEMPRWIFRKWAGIDPLKDANANLVLLRAGIISKRQWAEELGLDYDQIKTENVEDPPIIDGGETTGEREDDDDGNDDGDDSEE